MTAVIGIINKSAAAIAADSAVTVGGPKGPKIFNRANKIFTISKGQPVGLMIYNQGEFMGTPWETIIKLYRSSLKDATFGTVEEYKNHFIQFLHEKQFFCDVQQQKKMLLHFVTELLRSVLQGVINENQTLIQSRSAEIPVKLASLTLQRIDQIISLPFDSTKCCPEFIDFEMKEFDDFGFIGVPQSIQMVFHQMGIPIDIPTTIPKIKELIFRSLKSNNFFNYFAGLVFTGFGVDEIFPRLIPVNLSIAINNRLRYANDMKNKVEISHEMQSAIRPFAQIDVIDTILGGTDPGLYDLYLQQFQHFISKNNQAIADLVRSKDPDAANKILAIDSRQITTSLNALISQERKKRYIDPMMGAVGTLSKEDLAEMAESLIYLTYLKRRFTNSEESVGGPVDVAVITKGDGFIWIKRKHYFDPDLNHQFLRNY